MQPREYLIYFGNLFEAAQFFNEFENIPTYEYTLIAKSSSFCHLHASTQFQTSLLWKLPQTVVKVKEYRKNKIK